MPNLLNVNDISFQIAQDYLKERGIDSTLTDELGILIVPKARLSELVPHAPLGKYHPNSYGIVLPHYSIERQPTGYATARMIEPPGSRTGFKAKISPPPKLLAPGNLIPHAHFSLLNPELQRDQRVYLCESRLKADILALHGKFAIGLNGCWGFSSKIHNKRLLEDLWEFPWKNKKITILFDSNWDKEQVWSAHIQLAGLLKLYRSANVEVLKLPKSPKGEDWGIDDFAAYHGLDKTLEFLNRDGEAVEADELTFMKYKLNEEVVYCRGVKKYIEVDTGTMMSRGEFCDGAYANWIVYNSEGKQLSVARAWNTWEHRREVQNVVYEPGGPRLDKNFNTWPGMGCEPEEGDVGPFLEFIENNFPREDERRWLLQWLAYPIQNLGSKMATCLVQVSEEGTGKSLLASVMGKIYGANFTCIEAPELESAFNAQYAEAQLVCVEEMSKSRHIDNAKRVVNRLKTYITEPYLMVNEKYKPQYTIKNHANFMLNTNYADAIFMGEGDRRFFVAQVTPVVDRRGDADYWRKLAKWLFKNVSAIHYFFLNLDLDGFEPYGHAPLTAAKEEMIESSYSEEQALAKELMENREETLRILGLPTKIVHISAAFVLERYFERVLLRSQAPTAMQKRRFAQALVYFGASYDPAPLRTTYKQFRVHGLLRNTPVDRDCASADLDLMQKSSEGKF